MIPFSRAELWCVWLKAQLSVGVFALLSLTHQSISTASDPSIRSPSGVKALGPDQSGVLSHYLWLHLTTCSSTHTHSHTQTLYSDTD